MPTTYAKASPEVIDLIATVIEDYHPDLNNHGVKVDALWAFGDGNKPALKHDGYPALAIIKLNDVKARLRGLADATILLDKDAWDRTQEPRRIARIDHELSHLEVRLDDEGRPRLDDANRPKLSTKPHDLALGIFDSILSRHGSESDDAQSLKEASERTVQSKMPWG